MRSILSNNSCRHAAKPSGVTKPVRHDPCRPDRCLRSLDEYFWYISTDGIDRLATQPGTLSEVPRQLNDYTFDPSMFAQDAYPSSFHENSVWPPKLPEHLLCAIGSEGEECVGDRCYTSDVCDTTCCSHTFENWQRATQDWQDHFELSKTEDRGIGVYTKQTFKRDDVLGWYAGEIVPSNTSRNDNDYLMEMPIGEMRDIQPDDSDSGYGSAASSSSAAEPTEETIMIDGSRKGNWTRFINHSCEPYCEFRVRRVGNIRIMIVEAVKKIPKGVELSVNYGGDYYGPRTKKMCHCGSKRCVSRFRKKKEGLWVVDKQKQRVKKCARATLPLE